MPTQYAYHRCKQLHNKIFKLIFFYSHYRVISSICMYTYYSTFYKKKSNFQPNCVSIIFFIYK